MDQTRAGVSALDALRHDAPFDASLLEARADAALDQMRPHDAQRRYEDTLVDHPDNVDMLAELGQTELQLHQYDRAAAVDATFGSRFPENNAVRRFDHEYALYRSPELVVGANAQKGNSVLADNDWDVDTQLYSMPLADYWRIFGHQFSGRADTGDGHNVSRVRNGVGGDFRYYGWNASAEVHHSTGPQARTGAAGTLAFAPDDHWTFSGGLDTNDNALPWKAFQAGITGRSASASARYQFDAYRYFNAGYGVSRYSDDNLHQAWNAAWYERLFETPRHQVSMWINAGTNSNTATNRPYFNPPRDYTAQLTGMYQWTPWRNVDRSFSQRVYGVVGGYRQTDVGDSLLWEARLEQQWQLGPKTTLAYGLGLSSQRQDHARETSKLVYLNLDIPL